MGKQNIAICGAESAYIKKLFEYIASAYEDSYEISLFTSEETFNEYQEKREPDIIIYEDWFYPFIRNGKVTVALSNEQGKENTVYKYMSCEKIFSEVMAICAATNEAKEDYTSSKGKEVIGIYSPVKRCFQTSFALTLGQILAKNKKVLYLNFESFSGFDSLCRAVEKNDIFDLLYFSECQTQNFSYRVSSMKERIGNLDYISPVKTYMKYAEIHKEQWERLIDNILSKTEYECVILDLSEQVNGLLDVLRKCSVVYTLADDERISCAKVGQYQSLLRSCMYEDVLDKTKNIVVPRFREIPADFEMLPYSELADYIRRVISFDKEEKENARAV